MIVLDFQTFADAAAARGLNTVVQGIALAGFSWCALRCSGARSSMTRFAVWFATLLAVAALPFLSLATGSTVGNLRASGFSVSETWAARFCVAWAAIAAVLLIRLGFSSAHLYRLRRQCRHIDAASHAQLKEMFTDPGTFSWRRPQFLVSDKIQVPTALGFFRPAIVMPAWALRELTADELRAIVLHELAHLRRWDDWTNLAQKFLKALFFFHPVVWWIDSRLAFEREIACDDCVLMQMGNARNYAASLVSIAEKVLTERMRMGKALALAQNALGRTRELSVRLTQILDSKRRTTNHGWRPAIGMIVTLALLVLGAAPYIPEMIVVQPAQKTLASAAPQAAPVPVIPASLRWTTAEARAKSKLTDENTGYRSNLRGRHSFVVPAKERVKETTGKPKLVLAKAPARMKSRETLLVLDSTQMGHAGGVWMFSVWQYTSRDGVEMVQQTIVMNSI